jgi:hypothetical protein
LGEKERGKKKKPKINDWGAFFPWARHTLLAVLGPIKGLFKGQSLNFICT